MNSLTSQLARLELNGEAPPASPTTVTRTVWDFAPDGSLHTSLYTVQREGEDGQSRGPAAVSSRPASCPRSSSPVRYSNATLRRKVPRPPGTRGTGRIPVSDNTTGRTTYVDPEVQRANPERYQRV
jgi:hypothetical protein